jgi:hypothetical protein
MNEKKEGRLESLDKRLDEVDRKSSKIMKKLNDYEPYAVVGIALMFIITGLLSGIFLDTPKEPTTFVVIDLTADVGANQVSLISCEEEWFCTEWSECSLNESRQRECLDFNGCKTEFRKPHEYEECGLEEYVVPPITAMAAAGGTGKMDMLKTAIFVLALLTVLIVAGFIALLFAEKESAPVSLLALAYWLAMIGVPLAIYYAVTRKDHPVFAYIAFAVSITVLVVLVVLKPWRGAEIAELKSLNKILRKNDSMLESRTSRIKHDSRMRKEAYMKFLEAIKRKEEERELMVEGIKTTKMPEIRNMVRKLEKNAASRKGFEEVEKAVKEREKRFREMNKMLESWADRRRREREMIEMEKRSFAEGRKEAAEIEEAKKNMEKTGKRLGNLPQPPKPPRGGK